MASSSLRGMMIAFFFASATVSAFAGNTYYADASALDDSGDGMTPETAKKHIQAAVDLCAISGDTVKVAEGLYDDGVVVCSYDNMRARVVITNQVTLVAIGAREKTIISGAFDETDSGLGPNAVRGVYIYYSVNSTREKRSAGSVVRGFTICNGATDTSGNGGGLSMQESYAVNCVISNCVANRGGGISRGTAIRCLVTDCTCVDMGEASASTVFLNSVVARQKNGVKRLFSYPGSMVNCTVAGNGGTLDFGYGGTGFKLFNTIVVANAFSAFHSQTLPVASNCVVSVLGRIETGSSGNIVTNLCDYGFAAPVFDDWRTMPGQGAAKIGDAALLKAISLPAGLEDQRYIDYNGKPIPDTGAITCGAVQEVCAARASLVVFKDDVDWELDGYGPLWGRRAALNYMWTDAPGMLKVRRIGASLTNLVWYTQSTNGTEVAKLYPTMDNWTGVVPYAGVTNGVTAHSPAKTIYVDVAGSDETGDGSSGNPYVTIQKAIEAAPSAARYAYSVIIARAGEYKTGGTGAGRVVIPNKTPGSERDWWYKYIRIVAEEGPEKTFIIGGTGVDEHGYGTGALRCFNSSLPSLLQGFTLTGGHESEEGAVSKSHPTNGMIADCVISNNVGALSIIHQTPVIRCRFVDNILTSSSAGIVRASYGATANVIGCEILHSANSAAGSLAIGANSFVAFSAVNGPIGATSGYYASILAGGQEVASVTGARFCFAHGDALTRGGSGVIENCKSGKSRCVDFAHGDFRLRSDSPAFGMVTFDQETYRPYAVLDMDGNPLKADTLAGNTAGPRQKWSVEYVPQGLLMLVH